MKFSNTFIVTLVILLIHSITASYSEEDTAVPLLTSSSTQEERLLNTCATFLHDGGSPGYWRVDGTGDTLEEACDPYFAGLQLDCCHSGAGVNAGSECTNWNTAVKYTICGGSCKGYKACNEIAGIALGGSVKINSNACTSDSVQWVAHVPSCSLIGGFITGNVDIEIGSGACIGDDMCKKLGYNAQSVTSIKVPANECTETAFNSEGNLYGKCTACGVHSESEGTLQATDACCAADEIFYYDYVDYYHDEACLIAPSDQPSDIPSDSPSDQPSSVPSSMPSDIPSDSPSDQPSSVPSSMSSDIPSDSSSDQPSSVPSSMPSDIPSFSPSFLTSDVPSSVSSNLPSSEDEGCFDDKDATFFRIKMKSEFRKCKWLSKNNKIDRKKRYCGLNRVKIICKSTCSFCTCADNDSFTFELTNVFDPKKKTKHCDWLRKNSAVPRYCNKAFDGGAVMNACTKSCRLCECTDDDSFTFKAINISDPIKKIKTCSWISKNKKNREKRISRYCTKAFDGGAVMNACTKSCRLCG